MAPQISTLILHQTENQIKKLHKTIFTLKIKLLEIKRLLDKKLIHLTKRPENSHNVAMIRIFKNIL